MDLDVATVAAEPIAQLRRWLEEARAANLVEPAAMTLATCGPACRPAARLVLLRALDERGLVFFTNYESAKGRDLAAAPHAAATFYWDALRRQVRVEGSVARIAPEESDAYFARRPRGHQLNAWASPQSSVVPSRDFLLQRMRATEERFDGGDVPRPPHWGGFRLSPERFEFWQHRDDRLHDRIRYVRAGDVWRVERLAP